MRGKKDATTFPTRKSTCRLPIYIYIYIYILRHVIASFLPAYISNVSGNMRLLIRKKICLI